MFGDERQHKRELEDKVAVAADVERVGGDALKVEQLRRHEPVDGQARASERRGTETQLIRAPATVTQPLAITFELLTIRQPVVSCQHRLRALQMRVSGENRTQIAGTETDKSPLQGQEFFIDLVDSPAAPKPQVGRNLVIARTGGMEFAAGVADALNQCPLDVHVDVFELRRVGKLACFDIGFDRQQALLNRAAFFRRKQSDLGQHRGMGDRAGDVMRVEPLIKADAFGKLLNAGIRCRGKYS